MVTTRSSENYDFTKIDKIVIFYVIFEVFLISTCFLTDVDEKSFKIRQNLSKYIKIF